MDEETKQPEEVEEVQEPQPQAVNADPPEETVGDLMKKSSGEGIKFWMIVISAIIYLTGIVYAEVHGLTMLQKGVAPDMRIWATLGMVAAGMTAVIMPIVLKTWTIEARQRLFTYFFYAADFAFLIFNAFTDFNTQTGQQLAPWAQSYVTYVLPASPVIITLLWAIVWELDPSVKEKVLLLSLRAAMKQKMAQRVAEAAKGHNVSSVVNAAAEREVERALTELFGAPVSGYVMNGEDLPQRRNLLQSFFGGLFSQLQRVISMGMPTQSERPNSEDPKK
jgi:hypothetical protein